MIPQIDEYGHSYIIEVRGQNGQGITEDEAEKVLDYLQHNFSFVWKFKNELEPDSDEEPGDDEPFDGYIFYRYDGYPLGFAFDLVEDAQDRIGNQRNPGVGTLTFFLRMPPEYPIGTVHILTESFGKIDDALAMIFRRWPDEFPNLEHQSYASFFDLASWRKEKDEEEQKQIAQIEKAKEKQKEKKAL